MSDQIAFTTSDFADNPEPRCPCLLLLDVSASMQGKPITELNAGLITLRDELAANALAMARVELAIVTFGPVNIELPFIGAAAFNPPALTTQADTPMGAAITLGLELVRKRKDEYRTNGIAFYRPWVFMITDGGPTDSWRAAADAVRDGEASKAFSFFAVGVQGANINILRQISSAREPLELDGLKFGALFQWLSNSLGSVSNSTLGTEVPLKAPTGWASV